MANQLQLAYGRENVDYDWFLKFGLLYSTDINELNLPKTCSTKFDDPDDLLNFKLSIAPDEVSLKEVCSLVTINFDDTISW